ncbi:Bacterial Ig-like domain (group 2) [Tatumella ptyseos]|nr:phage tail tube protein [Tatumella ptyseos]SQK75734.1 Bacterial Ig-like domain (group 2) [Tatumella ptyseos]
MSSGAKIQTAYCRETTPGTTPASPAWLLLKRVTNGLKPTQNMVENAEIGGTRMANGKTPGTTDVGGDVVCKYRYGQHDDFLASCFGNDWVNNVLTMGNNRIAFSVASFASDIGVASIATGCQVGTFKLEIPNDGDLQATITLAGLDWNDKDDGTSYFDSPTDAAGTLRYSFKQVTAISLNGIAGGSGFCVDTFDIQFDNGLKTQRCIGTGTGFAGANIPTTFTPSGQITLSWSKSAYETWKKTLTGAAMPFSFTIANDEGSYTFDFPSVQVDGDWPDGGNTDIVQVKLNITGSDIPPTITRAPAAVAVTGITVTPTTASVAVGSTTTLAAALTPSNTTDSTVTWSSSDNTIATVDPSTGVVTGVAAGSATITASAGGVTATSAVTVTAA